MLGKPVLSPVDLFTVDWSLKIIKAGVISCKGFIPNIRLGNWMLQMSLVAEISVLDVLSKPVLSPFDLLILDGSIHLNKTFTE